MRRLLAALLLTLALGLPGSARAAKDELVIGITQFPSTLQPQHRCDGGEELRARHDAAAVHRLRRRTGSWSACSAPSCRRIENGQAVAETQRRRQATASRVTYTIQPERDLGRRHAGHDRRRAVHLGGRPPSRRAASATPSSTAASPRSTSIDDKTFTLHVDKLTFDYNGDQRLPAAAGASRAAGLRADPDELPQAHAVRHRPDQPRPLLRPLPHHRGRRRRRTSCSSRNPTWWGEPAALPAHHGARDREHRGARGQPAVRRDRHDRRRARPHRSTRRSPSRSATATRFQIIYKPGLVYEHIDLNLDNPILADRRVRQALLHGARPRGDQPAAVRRPPAGRRHLRQPARLGLRPTTCRTTATTRRAPRRCSTRPAGSAGARRHPRATRPASRLPLELMTTAGNRTRELVEQVLQSQWRELGIDIRIQNEPARVFFGETVQQAALYRAWRCSPGSARPRTCRARRCIPRRSRPRPTAGPGQNYTGFSNPEMDQLIDAHRDRARPRQAQGACGRELQRDLRRASCRRCRSTSAPSRSSAEMARRACGRPGTSTPATLWVEHWRAAGELRAPARHRHPAIGPPMPAPVPMLRYLSDRLLEAALVLLADVVRRLRPDRADAGRSDRPDGERRSAHDRRPTSRGCKARATASTGRCSSATARWAGSRAAGRFRLFARFPPAGARGAAAAPRQHAAADGRRASCSRSRSRCRSASWPRAAPRGRLDDRRSTCSPSPASRCRPSGSRCC